MLSPFGRAALRELGRVRFKDQDVSDLLELYGVTAVPNGTSCWRWPVARTNPAGGSGTATCCRTGSRPTSVSNRPRATIRNYEMQFVPGLLQTAEYARVVIGLGRDADPEGRAVDVRMRRQALLRADGGPELVAVVDEAALHRPFPGVAQMRRQLRHLAEMVESPSVQIRIVPFGAGMHVAAGGALRILDFADSELPRIVYLEQLMSALYLDKRTDVDRYDEAMERLRAIGAGPHDAPAVLERISRSL